MEMNQTQTVAQSFLVQQFEGLEQLGTGESELRGVASALFPFAGPRGCQFDTDADIGFDVELLRYLGDDLQLVHLLHHDEDLLTHFLRQECQFDIALVLVAVADDDGVTLTLHGNDGMELRLRTSFQS